MKYSDYIHNIRPNAKYYDIIHLSDNRLIVSIIC